ncbi:hypothetical protein ACIA8E_39610 [Streptomyces sp. NPDC051664]|uniref:hypothetical protein n=1 Tax=Streptomyces sp. NPDC051664 TaxID=3365668 RepID=UPI0037B5BBDE
MASGDHFGARPADVKSGGGLTDNVGTLALHGAETYAEATRPGPNPPWGEGDSIAEAFERNYKPASGELREAVLLVAKALHGAADMTVKSGLDFEKASDDATRAISSGGHR